MATDGVHITWRAHDPGTSDVSQNCTIHQGRRGAPKRLLPPATLSWITNSLSGGERRDHCSATLTLASDHNQIESVHHTHINGWDCCGKPLSAMTIFKANRASLQIATGITTCMGNDTTAWCGTNNTPPDEITTFTILVNARMTPRTSNETNAEGRDDFYSKWPAFL